MRAVLRTLAQCHAQHILHRDIKPGNFMLLSGDDRAPLKAIDFGLAAPFDPEQLPRTDLGLEGTPWYMGECMHASACWDSAWAVDGEPPDVITSPASRTAGSDLRSLPPPLLHATCSARDAARRVAAV